MSLTRQHIQGDRPAQQRRFTKGVVIREEDIQQFLAGYERMNRTEGTVQFYRRKMKRFYEGLPAEKTVRYGTLQNWRDSLLRNGYTPGLANAVLSAANAYLDYIGHREYQLAGQFKEEKAPVHRTYVSAVIRNLCEKAQIPSEKENLKSLRKLYLSTKAGIESNVALLVEQAMERMMEQEQFSIGWEDS